ncbi:MAG TPA: sigma-70 family RNA polymerase sigma factor [Bryobacteraceae bacterium]
MEPTNPDQAKITELLARISSGDTQALKELFGILHGELKRMAIAQMARERKDHTLQPTALVNEVFVRLAAGREKNLIDLAHLLAVASNAMRHILVDHARARLSNKRGSGRKVSLDDNLVYDRRRPEDMLDLDRALSRLEALSPRQARVVEMRFFGGLNEEQIATALDVSTRTVKRDWQIARAWLYGELKGGGSGSGESPEDTGSGGPLVPARPKGHPPTGRGTAALSAGKT